MSYLLVLLKLKLESQKKSLEDLNEHDVENPGALETIRLRLTQCCKLEQWQRRQTSFMFEHGSVELMLDVSNNDVHSVSLRIFGLPRDWTWLSTVREVLNCHVYDAQTGGWFDAFIWPTYSAWRRVAIVALPDTDPEKET